MTLAEIRARVAKLIAYEGNTAEGMDPSGSSLDDYINLAQDELSRRVYLYDGRVVLTTSASAFQIDVQGEATSRRMLEVHQVIIEGERLLNFYGQPGLHTFPELNSAYPDWTDGSLGEVVAAAFSAPTLVLTAAPSGELDDCYLQGRVLADTLTASSQVSDLPVETHELVCFLAASFLQQPVIDTEDAFARLREYKANALDLLSELYISQYMAVHGHYPSLVPGMRGAS